MYENPVPNQNPSEKPPKRKFWQNLLIMDSGDLKKILSLSSMMLSFVLIFCLCRGLYPAHAPAREDPRKRPRAARESGRIADPGDPCYRRHHAHLAAFPG